jgi:hypothetical protein
VQVLARGALDVGRGERAVARQVASAKPASPVVVQYAFSWSALPQVRLERADEGGLDAVDHPLQLLGGGGVSASRAISSSAAVRCRSSGTLRGRDPQVEVAGEQLAPVEGGDVLRDLLVVDQPL